MSLLIKLNETGFQTLKKDRNIILEKLKELKIILKELDYAYFYLKEFYEPKIKIIREDSIKGEMYMGEIFIAPPYNVTKRKIIFPINFVNNYKGELDEKLKEDAEKEARNILKKTFPINFE
jgi:hypothetical protein